MAEKRTTEQRKADVLAMLERHGDAWIATAGRSGEPHLIVVAAVWHGDRIVTATREASRTARNLTAGGGARLGLGNSDDVVMIDAEVDRSLPAADAGEIGQAFEAAVGWNPVDEGPDWRYFVLRPSRIQAYRGYGELAGRNVMKDGRWLA